MLIWMKRNNATAWFQSFNANTACSFSSQHRSTHNWLARSATGWSHWNLTENLRSVKQLPQLLDLSDFPLCIFVSLCRLIYPFGPRENPSPSLGRGSFLHGLRQGNYIYTCSDCQCMGVRPHTTEYWALNIGVLNAKNDQTLYALLPPWSWKMFIFQCSLQVWLLDNPDYVYIHTYFFNYTHIIHTWYTHNTHTYRKLYIYMINI